MCPAGVPTIGYGATYYEDGRSVRLADPAITADQADALLMWMLRTRYAPAVATLCPAADTVGRRAALIDFAFNLGIGALRSSTLRRRVAAGDWPGARDQLARWIRGGGRVLVGLVRRRADEAALM